MDKNFVLSDFVRKFEMIPGKTPMTGTVFVSTSMILFLSSLYFLSKFMEKRKPFKLKWVAFGHNLVCTIISLVTACGMIKELIRLKVDDVFKGKYVSNLLCLPRGSHLAGPLYFWGWIYHCTKFYELIDTYLIVLRKNQKGLTYLHVLHHSAMLFLVLEWFYGGFAFLWFPVVVNSGVHVVMYFYYSLVSIGIRFKYKNMITIIQLLQFFFGGIYFLCWLPGRLFFNINCSGNFFVVAGAAFFDLYYLYLFLDFYMTSFRTPKKPKQKVEALPTHNATEETANKSGALRGPASASALTDSPSF